MIVFRTNGITGKTNSMELPISQEQIDRWQNGELIQDVMPELEPHQREFLITGMTVEEQHAFYSRLEELEREDEDDRHIS